MLDPHGALFGNRETAHNRMVELPALMGGPLFSEFCLARG